MVRSYHRKSCRGSWIGQNMDMALSSVNSGTSLREAARNFGIPRETLRRRLEASKKGISLELKLGRFDPVFPRELERELANHIISMQDRFFGLNSTDVRRLAYELALKNNLPNSFCKETQLAGIDWLKGFRKRHPEIALRTPEKTSVARARCFNKPTVGKFYQMMKQVHSEGKFSPHRIFNVDETAITTVSCLLLIYIHQFQHHFIITGPNQNIQSFFPSRKEGGWNPFFRGERNFNHCCYLYVGYWSLHPADANFPTCPDER